MDNETVKNALKAVKYPGFSRDIVSFGLVKDIVTRGDKVEVVLNITTADPNVPAQLKADVEQAVRGLPGVSAVDVQIAVSAPKAPPPQAAHAGGTSLPSQLRKVRYIVAVASGKGGVGKTTFAVNLACALDQMLSSQGKPNAVGILDCDIYGPSVPLMLGVKGQPEIEGECLIPMRNFGVRMMSMGCLVDEDTPVVWRGPMVMKAIQQFITNVAWGELEVLVVDLPPGTGDAQLTLAQSIPLAGAVIVTTPQTAAVNVARRGALMFEKVNVPLLGVAENMSYIEDPATGARNHIFGEGGGAEAAKFLKTSLLGQVPLDARIREGGDRGIPIVIAYPESNAAQAFRNMADNVWKTLQAPRP